ncbi:MAG: hypothetical protein MJD61_03400 [Proteobacteria bacterium]|nr:hypothetical protein [Pseudomonadota bacterium]
MTAILTNESSKTFNRVNGIWFITILTVGLLSEYLKLSLTGIYVFDIISNIVPSIDRVSSKSNYYHSLRIVWFYLLFSSPIVFWLRWKRTEINYESVNAISWILFPIILFVSFSICFTGSVIWWVESIGTGSGRWALWFRESLIGAILISGIFWYVFTEMLLLLLKMLIHTLFK